MFKNRGTMGLGSGGGGGPGWSTGYQLLCCNQRKISGSLPKIQVCTRYPTFSGKMLKKSLIFNQSDVFPIHAFLILLTGGHRPATLVIPRQRSLLNARRIRSCLRPVFMMEHPSHPLAFVSLCPFEHLFPGFIFSSTPSLSPVFPSVDLRVPFLGLSLLPTLPYLVPHDCSHICCKQSTMIIEAIRRTMSMAFAINLIESLNYYYCKIYFIYGPRNLQGKLTKWSVNGFPSDL